jgi:hypothetical protein
MLGLTVAQSAQLTEDYQRALQEDVLDKDGEWSEAAIVKVRWDAAYVVPPGNSHNMAFDEAIMHVLTSARTVLFDDETNLPILAWASAGCEEVAKSLRTHFEPLAKASRFNVARTGDGTQLTQCPPSHGPSVPSVPTGGDILCALQETASCTRPSTQPSAWR